MNFEKIKRKQSKIIGIIVTVVLLAMSVPINTEITASTANTTSVAELETTA